MRKVRFAILIVFAIFLTYACSKYRYPNYGGVSRKTVHKRNAARNIDNKLYRGIGYLKEHRCKRAITSFSNIRSDSFYKFYWMSVAKAQCRRYSYAVKELKNISNDTQDNIWSARIYASLGFFLMLSHKSGAKDYLDISLAYNMHNRLAYILKFGKYRNYERLSKLEKNKAKDELFNIILSWYKR